MDTVLLTNTWIIEEYDVHTIREKRGVLYSDYRIGVNTAKRATHVCRP